jgi:hypothetical protein
VLELVVALAVNSGFEGAQTGSVVIGGLLVGVLGTVVLLEALAVLSVVENG